LSTEETLRVTVVALIQATGETQRVLAEATGLPQPQISRRQRGVTVWTLRDVDALAAHWGISAVDLLAGPTRALERLTVARRAAALHAHATRARPPDSTGIPTSLVGRDRATGDICSAVTDDGGPKPPTPAP